MTFRFVAVSSAIVVASLVAAATGRAECFSLTGQHLLEDPTVPVIFSGTVVELTRIGEEATRVTFDVDRVWKGSVAKRFVLYASFLEAETPRFELLGEHWVVAAAPLASPRARKSMGLGETDTIAFTPVQCSGALSRDIVRALGVGQPPK